MRFLAISGSARRCSTNTALLRAVQSVSPRGIDVSVFGGVDKLPIFSPDLEGANLPEPVRHFIRTIVESDGLIIASPEYVRSIPGGLKNAIDWLVSGEEIVGKPIALLHASHRGDDMLEALRFVLSTVSDRFAAEIFLRFPLMTLSPDEVRQVVEEPENRSRVQGYLKTFAAFCQR